MVEFARIDAEAKDERDKQMGFRGKACLPVSRLYNFQIYPTGP